MKCEYCDSEFEGNYCPYCGAKASISNNAPFFVETNAKGISAPIESKIKKPFYKKWWFWFLISVGTIIAILQIRGIIIAINDLKAILTNTDFDFSANRTLFLVFYFLGLFLLINSVGGFNSWGLCLFNYNRNPFLGALIGIIGAVFLILAQMTGNQTTLLGMPVQFFELLVSILLGAISLFVFIRGKSRASEKYGYPLFFISLALFFLSIVAIIVLLSK
jgi:hypothetical protein